MKIAVLEKPDTNRGDSARLVPVASPPLGIVVVVGGNPMVRSEPNVLAHVGLTDAEVIHIADSAGLLDYLGSVRDAVQVPSAIVLDHLLLDPMVVAAMDSHPVFADIPVVDLGHTGRVLPPPFTPSGVEGSPATAAVLVALRLDLVTDYEDMQLADRQGLGHSSRVA